MAVPDTATPIQPPCVLVVDADDRLLGALTRVLERQGYRVLRAAHAAQAISQAEAHQPDLALVSLELDAGDAGNLLSRLRSDHPETVCIVLTAAGNAARAFAALNAGAYDYFETPIADWTRFDQVLRNAWMVRELRGERDRLRELASLHGSQGLKHIIGHSHSILQVRDIIVRVASIRVPVLVLGESGTGKELVARALHAASPWRDEPFVDINCAAIPGQLLESELFGHEKGAFTGADQRRRGLLEVAGEGTIFLDEIGELPIELQAKLLRVLGSSTFRRVGGARSIPSRARVITATNRDLPAMVRAGGFREDLLYRLNVIDIRVPPLRERREDIPLLAWFFVDRFNRVHGRRVRRITPEALAHLTGAAWQDNNVRQLENAVERAMVLARGDELDLELFEDRIPRAAPVDGLRSAASGARLDPALLDLGYREAKDLVIGRFSRAYIEARLAECGGNIAEAARRSGQERPNFKRLMKRFGVDSPAKKQS